MTHERLEGTTNALKTILDVKEIPSLELWTPAGLEYRNVNKWVNIFDCGFVQATMPGYVDQVRR